MQILRNGKEVVASAVSGVAHGIVYIQARELQAFGRCIGLLAFSAGLFALGGLVPGSAARRLLRTASLLIAAGDLWSSRRLVRAIVEPTARSVTCTLDQQWLRANPITYA
jgi:hypothetical protein